MENYSERLKKLIKLYEDKVVSFDEFRRLKTELLERYPNEQLKKEINSINDGIVKSTNNVEKTEIKSSLKQKKNLTPAQIFLVLSFILIGGYLGISSQKSKISDSSSSSTTQQQNNNNSESASNSTSTFYCSVCGKQITGSGYEEVSNGVWQPCNYPYQCQICSPECGKKHTAEMNSLMDKVESQSTVKQGNYPVCNLCHGTGIEKPMGANSFGETGRICPMCNGTGYQKY
jgi:uncharacterized protein (UPF0333 family)